MRHTVSILLLVALSGCAPAPRHSPALTGGGSAVWDPTAEAGVLTFSPERPLPAQPVKATYQASSGLTGEPHLHLLARLRTSEHGDYNDGMESRTVAVLERQPDGAYRGSFSLPAEVVYAAFAVEDVEATRTDSREGRFWELLMHGSDGRPLADALRQRFNDHMGRDYLVVLESAREHARLYPEDPAGWSLLRQAEGWVLGRQGVEERLTRHREALHAADRALAERPDLGAEEVGHLYWNARALGVEVLAERWRERLFTEHPGQFFAVGERVMELSRAHREDPATLLRELEALFFLAGDRRARGRIVGPALTAARRIGDAGTILLWADRSVEVNPTARASVAITLSVTEATRAEGIRRLLMEISTVEQVPDEERPLGATVAEHQERVARQTAELRTSLGQALLAASRTQEGIAALENAAAVGWNTSRFRNLGEARLSSGDSEGATRAFAAVAADPATSRGRADSLRLALNLEPAPWEEAVTRARAEMLERTLQSARAEPLPSVTVAERNGSPVRLEELFGGAGAVVVFWSQYCPVSVQAMPQIAALAERLEREGVRLLAITRNSPAAAEAYLQEGGWSIQVLFDSEGEAARVLNSWGTPQYFVLDGAGRLRFAFSSLDDLPRQIAALRDSRGE
jgi:peroxiredoxin